MRNRTSTLNMDCLDYMKSLPDNAFDLIIADPPYGDCDGSWGGVGQGSRTTQDAMPDTLGGGEEVRRMVQPIQTAKRFGARFDRYRAGGGGCFRLHGGGGTQRNTTSETMASSGTLLQTKRSSKRCSESPRIKSYGVATTSTCLRQGALSYGRSCPFRRVSAWRCASMLGRASRA